MRPNTAKIINNKPIEFDEQDIYNLQQSQHLRKIKNNLSPQRRILTAFRAHRKHLFQGDNNQQFESPASKTLSKAPSLRQSQLREDNLFLQDSLKFQFSKSLRNIRALQQVSKKWVPKNELDGFDYFGSSIINYQTGLKLSNEPHESPGSKAFTQALSKMKQQKIINNSNKEQNQIEKKSKPFHEAYIEKIIQKHNQKAQNKFNQTNLKQRNRNSPEKVRPYKMLYVQGHSYTQNNNSQPNMLSSSVLTQNKFNNNDALLNNYQFHEPFKSSFRQSICKQQKPQQETPHNLFKNPLIKDTFSRLSSLNEFSDKTENIQSFVS